MGRFNVFVKKATKLINVAQRKVRVMLQRRQEARDAVDARVKKVRTGISHMLLLESDDERDGALALNNIQPFVETQNNAAETYSWTSDPFVIIQNLINTILKEKNIVVIVAHAADLISIESSIEIFPYCDANEMGATQTMANMPYETDSKHALIYVFAIAGLNQIPNMLEANRILEMFGFLYILELKTINDNMDFLITHMNRCGFDCMNVETYDDLYYIIKFNKVAIKCNVTANGTNFGLRTFKYRKIINENGK